MRRVVADQIQAIVAWPRERCRRTDSRRYGRKLLMQHARDRAMGRFRISDQAVRRSFPDAQRKAFIRLLARTIHPSGASRP